MLTPRLEVAHSAVYTADRPPRPADPASDPLAGRATLLAALPALLASTRVLTISGPPGVGKSALLAAAQRRTPAGHRVLALDTSPFETEGALLAALAEGAGAARPERAAVAVALEASPTLLVLDGVEGVRAAAAALATAAPRLRLLVGSTTPLGLPEEHVLRLAFLPAQRRALRMQASLPRALEASVRRCLERLSPAARAALEVAASPPRGPRLEDLRAALERRGLDPNLIEALRWRSLLCEDPARACPPPGVREALLDDGLEPDLERTWAEVLQDSLREAARAGEARTRAWAPDAEHILGLAGRLPPATAVGLLDAATPALAWHRPPGLGAALSAQLLDHARAAGDPEAAARGEAWSALFEVAFELPPDPLPVPTLGQGPEAALRAAAQALDHAARAEPHAALTWLTAARGQRLDPAHPAGAAAAWLLARAAAEAGWAPEARAEASRALTWARRAGHRTVEGLALVELAALSLAEDRAAEAAARMAEAEGAGEWCQPGLLVQRATLAALAGARDEAVVVAAEAHRAALALGDTRAGLMAALLTGAARLGEGRRPEAERTLGRVAAHLKASPWARLARLCAGLLANAGLPEEAADPLPGALRALSRPLATPAPEALIIQRRGAWFRHGDGPVVELGRRGPARRILVALGELQLRAPGRGAPPDVLFAWGWPGQALAHEHLVRRVYVTIHDLRHLGLERALQRSDDGYLLDPACPVRLED